MMSIETLRQDRDALVRELTEAGATVRGNAVRCPFHEDKHPSGDIYRADDGVWRFKCHADECGFCGDVFDVRAEATGHPLDEVLREASGNAGRGRQPKSTTKLYPTIQDLRLAVSRAGDIEAEFTYSDPDTGRTDMLVFRLRTSDGKTFRQAHPVENGWVMKAGPKPWPLYNRRRVRAADEIVVVEGENCVHALHDVGIVATTNPGGAGKAEHCDWRPLAGKRVILWPDNDVVGRNHIRQVAGGLERLDPPPRLSIIEPADLDLTEEHADAADFIAECLTVGADPRQEIRRALSKAQPLDPLTGYRKRQAAIMRGELRMVPLPWPHLTGLTWALRPGRVTILAGSKGAAKSFMLLQCMRHWLDTGEKAAVLVLEGSPDEYLDRALSQLTGNASFTNPDWQKEHPDDVRAAMDLHADELSRLSLAVTRGRRGMTLEQVADWVESQVASKRVVCIDPVTAAMRTGKPWVVDPIFLDRVRHAVEMHRVSAVLVSHLQKGAAEGAVDALAGSAAYERFSDTIIQLIRHDPKSSPIKNPLDPAAVDCDTSLGREPKKHNQTVFIEKARAPGGGMRLAYRMTAGLELEELGVIVKKAKTDERT